nr:hypothetical protein [Tanacetum cinerariifolium]
MQAADLEWNVSRDEIRLAVWNCGENKSPAPDRYTFEFFRKYWNIVGPDFCEAVEYFLRPACFPKILANRLALVIADLVSDTQSAFVANRQILDGPFILNEILHWCKRKKKQAMFFKVDFTEAYDSVRWDYLLDVLDAFRFGQTRCKWIRVDEGLFKGVHLQGSISIFYLFYADDAMFIGEWSDGGRVYVSSSRMGRYGAKLRSRLSNWKVKTLSIGGRLTLLKSVLGASPLDNMSIFKVPKGILKSMEAIRSNFSTELILRSLSSRKTICHETAKETPTPEANSNIPFVDVRNQPAQDV